MKIRDLYDNSHSIYMTNEENAFVSKHGDTVSIPALYDHDQVLARTLVRKGIYDVADDNVTMVLRVKNGRNQNI